MCCGIIRHVFDHPLSKMVWLFASYAIKHVLHWGGNAQKMSLVLIIRIILLFM